MSVQAPHRRMLRLREIPRDSLAQRNALCRAHEPVRVEWLGRPWALSITPQDEDLNTSLIAQADWGGAQVAVGLTQASTQTLGEMALEGLWLPGQPAQLALALLAYVCEDLCSRAERALRKPLRWSGLLVQAPSGAQWARVGWSLDGGDRLMHGCMWLDPTAIRFLTATLRALRDAPAAADRDWDALPCATRFVLGWTDLTGEAVRQLGPHDLVLLDESFLDPAGGLHVQVSPQLGFTARWDGAQLTVLDSLKAIMTDPNFSDPATEQSLLDELPVRLTFDLGERTLTLGELRALRSGYIFNLGRDPRACVQVRANGKLVGEGELVDIEGRVGVALVRMGQTAD